MLLARNTAEVHASLDEYSVRDGKFFNASYSAALASAGTLAMHITAPAASDNKHIVCKFKIGTDKVGSAVITEGDTLAGGSSVTTYNADRNSLLTTPCTIKQGASISGGTSIRTVYCIPGISNDILMILKPSTTYTITFTSATTTTTVIANLDYYKE